MQSDTKKKKKKTSLLSKRDRLTDARNRATLNCFQKQSRLTALGEKQ